MRRTALLFFSFFHSALAGCGGSGATVPAVSEMVEARDGGAVAPGESAKPVTPGIHLACKTTKAFYDGQVHTLRLLVRDGELVEPLGDVPAIEVTPESSELARLNDDLTSEHAGGRLLVRGDGKTELALFDDSGLTKGYVKADGDYAEVFCTKDR
jgi:hypothetical protein